MLTLFLLNAGLFLASSPSPSVSPTPSPSPTPPVVLDAVVNVTHNPPRGFYTGSLTIWLTTDCALSTVWYTTNGTFPAAGVGRQYSDSTGILLNVTTLLCTFAQSSTCKNSQVRCHTYIFLETLVKQPKTTTPPPGFAGLTPSGKATVTFGFDQTVVASAGASLEAGLRNIPTVSLGVPPTVLPLIYTSVEFRNAIPIAGQDFALASIEVILADDPNNYTMGTFCGLTGHSDPETKRSFRTDFSSVYGAGSFFFPSIEDFPEMGSSKKNLESVIFRSGNQENWATCTSSSCPSVTFLRDPFYRSLQVQVNEDGIASHTTFVNLYINGQYWGLYNVAERPDDKWAANYMGGDNADYFAVNGGTPYATKIAPTTDHSDGYKALFSSLIPAANTFLPHLPLYVDIPRFFDYLLISWYVGLNDWPAKNYWVVANGNNLLSPYRYLQWYAWDGEVSLGGNGPAGAGAGNPGAWVHPKFRTKNTGGCDSTCTAANNYELPVLWWWAWSPGSPVAAVYQDIFVNEAFRLLVQKSPLRTDKAQKLWSDMAAYIDQSIWAESARWGDSTTKTHSNWMTAQQNVYSMLALNEQRLLQELQKYPTPSAPFYPNIIPPQFSRTGGSFDPPSTSVTIFNLNRDLIAVERINVPTITVTVNLTQNVVLVNRTDLETVVNGTLCYSICWTADPVRQPCNATTGDPRVSATSSLCKTGSNFYMSLMENVTLDLQVPAGSGYKLVVLAARIWMGSWSPLIVNEIAVGQNLSTYLKITEIMYNSRYEPAGALGTGSPLIQAGDCNYLEVFNANSAVALDLSGVSFIQGVEFSFPKDFLLGPNQYAVVCEDPDQFAWCYPRSRFTPCSFKFSDSKLSDSSDNIIIEDDFGQIVLNMTYYSSQENSLWPLAREGECIALRSPPQSFDSALASSWQLCSRICPRDQSSCTDAKESGTPGCADQVGPCFECAQLASGGCCKDSDCSAAGSVCVGTGGANPTCCVPQAKTCFTEGLICGSLWNGCKTVQCGTCLAGQCTGGRCSCTPNPTLPQDCGSANIGCTRGSKSVFFNITDTQGSACAQVECAGLRCPAGRTCQLGTPVGVTVDSPADAGSCVSGTASSTEATSTLPPEVSAAPIRFLF